ncbi:hypothetical protein TNCV_1825671 [Trichonephila clavipes]|nr:hypothetical protein TNCV_1825671 [Trichonephila clavipes]
MWNVTDWQKVVFSDESRFVLGTDDNRVRVWRHPGERYNPPHTVLRHTVCTAGVMFWGAIAYDSRSTLYVMCGNLTGQHYVYDILLPHTLSWPARSPDLSPVEQLNALGSTKTADAIVSLCTCFRVGCSRFVGPSASGQHKMSNELNAVPCGGMYCSWRWSNTLLNLPSISVVAHPVFV